MRLSPLVRLLIVGRLGLILSTAFVLASVANWLNYRSYWNGTIRRVQTVDFNLLSHTLPTRLSYLLLNQEREEIQQTLNSNYGFFGIVITDCPVAELDCPNQEIIYKTDSRRDWVQKLENPETAQQILKESPFNILRDPPPLWTEGSFNRPREETLESTGKVNQGQIIGRVYYIRGSAPEFWQDYTKWLQKLPTSFLSDSGASKYYALTMSLLLIQGLIAWWFFERILLFKRGQQAKLKQDNQRLLEEASKLEQEYQGRLVTFTDLLQQKEQNLIELRLYRQEQEQQRTELQTEIDVLENQLLQNDQDRQERIRQLEELRQILYLERQEQTLTQEQLQQRQQEIDQLSEHLKATERERKATQRELKGLQQELIVTKHSEQQAQDRTSILEQSIAEFREQLQTEQKKYQDALQESNILQNQLNESEGLQILFEQDNQKLTENNRRLAEQNKRIEQLNQDLEYLQEFKQENQSLMIQIREFQEKCKHQEKKIDRLQCHLNNVKHQLRKQSNNNLLLEKNHKTIYALLLEVEKQYEDILQIWDSAWSSAKALEFKPFEKVYIAFEVLAQTGRRYFDCLFNGESMGAYFWQKAFQDRGLSNVYRTGESEATMNQYGRERIFTHGEITQHLTLKLGNDRTLPCLQIYFEINRDEEIIEIGYCGRHLSNPD
ncbi:hypothetical protein [Chroococcus sp. FPU101]|uniref:hypothetical protein n=1 Tax=Chroococcus sp. FPU101 TaxID=1974212 RepID=UPI001A8EBC85|nr:hypothetical protein [Chroococcus sp. FPU101]GFE71029.1 hypothetical protein CFPU101_36390 [Chroococcus sp. FPU101]